MESSPLMGFELDIARSTPDKLSESGGQLPTKSTLVDGGTHPSGFRTA